jgi:hypothetical protein
MASLLDFGCTTATYLEAAQGVGGVVALFLSLVLAGGLIGGKKRIEAADFFSGWGLLTLVLLDIGLDRTLPLSAGVAGVLLLAVIQFGKRALKERALPIASSLIVAVIFLFPVLPLINQAGITGWDDFSHWSPNRLFFWAHDALPDNAHTLYSVWPSYPPAFTFLGFAASLLQGAFVVQAGALAAWLVLGFFAYLLARERPLFPEAFLPNFAAALLLVTLANPGFNASFSIMGGSDTPTMALLGALGLLLMRVFEKLQRREAFGGLTGQTLLVALTFALTRQMNLVLLLFLLGGFTLAAAREKRFKPAVLFSLVLFVPALLAVGFWTRETNAALHQAGFTPRLPADWNYAVLPALFRAMGEEMLRKGGLFALLFGVVIAGGQALFARESRLRLPLLMSAALTLGTFAFLVAAYIGSSFSTTEAERAASFYRYMSHGALLALVPIWLKLGTLVAERGILDRFWPRTWAALGLLALFPLVAVLKPVWLVMPSRPALCADRALGRRLALHLGPDQALCFVDLASNGMTHFIVNHTLALDALTQGGTRHLAANADATTAPETLAKIAHDPACARTYVAAPETEAQTATLRRLFPALPTPFPPEGFVLGE